ncbi:hypothetical protein OSS47_23270 [Pseudomonas citronellolis]|uniref:hypothetical protein n=1 Tax=Pseudomonas citronellolis TaxID=53408 RepID=UPI00227133B4|nr:hypothetical protein [Pseudomonas citronellolis]WAB91024.1 hypothetical protein OSS47_23270 [Pseudomonas citronellolis]
MANVDSIQAHVNAGARATLTGCEKDSQLEKISSSGMTLGESDLLGLRGKRLDVVQSRGAFLPESRFIARVMAVQLPAPGSAIETSLLLLEEGSDDDCMDFVDISHLTILSVLA